MSLKALKKHCTTKHDPAGRTPGPDDKPAVALAIERLETISWGLRNGYRVEESTDLVSRHGARNVLYACACAKNKRSPAGFVRWHLETAQKAAPDGWEDPQLRELAQEASTVPADGSDESDRPKQHAPTPVPTTDAADVPLRAALTTALPPGVSVVAVAREGDKVAVWLPQAAVYGTILGRKLKRVAGEVLGVPVVVECREATMDRLAVFRV